MQRLYSVFPNGPPGLGLLLLRLVLAAYLISTGIPMIRSVASVVEAMTNTVALGISWVICAVLIGTGLLTPLVQTAVATTQVCVLIYQHWPWTERLVALGWGWPEPFSVVIAASLVLLGPGAYSIDAYLFGRREIDIPRLSREPLQS